METLQHVATYTNVESRYSTALIMTEHATVHKNREVLCNRCDQTILIVDLTPTVIEGTDPLGVIAWRAENAHWKWHRSCV